VFLLVLAHPGRPGQRAVKRLSLCCVVVISHLLQNIFETESCVTGHIHQLLHLKKQGPIFYHDMGKFDPCSGIKLEI